MRIGVILDNEFTIDIRVSNEVNYLRSIGYEIHILCPNYNNQKEFEVINDISIHRFRLSKSTKNKLFGLMNTLPLYEILWIKKVRTFVNDIKPQYLHAHDLYMAKIAYKGGEGVLPVILDLHENFPAAILSYKWSSKFPYNLLSRPKAWQKKEFKYLEYASKIIVLSKSFKSALTQRYPKLKPQNIFIYPNVPDVKQMFVFPIKADIFLKKERFILFYFGGISERRGIFTCFEAIKILSNKIPSIHLLLIGPIDGHEQATFDQYMNNPTLKERVTHYPWKDISEFSSYAIASNICLSPIFKNEQHESGVANKVFQYMLFSKPLIVSDCTPQIEIVEGSNCGLVFRSNDAIDLAEKIKYLYDNPKLCAEMGVRGNQSVLDEYNLIKCGEQLKNLYKSLS
ncbi:MAG: glycosyltransferase family 4 protein [Bacteroidales bacterium]|nr:glycosyltransferase family 4 protein [Bacteroidales bacterium]